METVIGASEFGYVAIIPVYHNFKARAFLLLGDGKVSDFKVSPILKNLRFIPNFGQHSFVALDNRALNEQRIENEKLHKEIELMRDTRNAHSRSTLKKTGLIFQPSTRHIRALAETIMILSKYLQMSLVLCGRYLWKGYFGCSFDVKHSSRFRAEVGAGRNMKDLIEHLNTKVIDITQGRQIYNSFFRRIDPTKTL